MRSLPIVLFAAASFGCASSSSSSLGAPTGNVPQCFDAKGAATTSCPVPVAESTCPQGDANDCAKTTLLDVTADDGTHGVCMHVVLLNTCDHEIFSDTCIATTAIPEGWQCWRSSTPAGATIDVSECQATGKVFHYSSASTGSIDTEAQSCPKP